MISKNISEKDIHRAIENINDLGIQESRKSRKYHLNYCGKNYPPKLVMSLANRYANGCELAPENFSGGKESNEFLRGLGFEIIEENHQSNLKKPANQKPTKKHKHSERCKECKKNLYKFLDSIFGEVKQNYQLDIGTNIEDYSSHSHYVTLKSIYQNLCNFRGNDKFIKTRKLPKVDYFIASKNCIVEFDESQHFTQLRRTTLEKYPENLELGFNKNQ